MFNLPVKVELKEILVTSDDVKFAFKRRGYQLDITSSVKRYCINASIKNIEGETIKYEFTGVTPEKCFLQAAVFLRQVQKLRRDIGLEAY